jgi:hypothetical protein
MRTATVEVFKYSELSDKAKERARDWFRDGDELRTDSVYEDAQKIAGLIGIEFKQREFRTMGGQRRNEPVIQWSGFSAQGDGASFEGGLSPLRFAVAHASVLEYAPKDERLHAIAAELDRLQGKYGNRLSARISLSRGNYCHSGMMQIEASAEDSDGNDSEVNEDDAKELTRAIRQFGDWIYSQLQAEYEFQNSDETVSSNIEANEYEFTAEGKFYE